MRMSRGMLLGVLLCLFAPAVAAAQTTLAAAAERARRAWQAHHPEELVGRSPRLTLSLPAMAPADALEPAQATALFRELFSRGTELETVIRAVRTTGAGEGYVELRRRFRLAGTQEVAQQTVLLAFRLSGEQWLLAEVRVLE